MIEHFDYISTQELDGVLAISLARAEKKNALIRPMLGEILLALKERSGDKTGVLLTGEGDVFSAGHDFNELADLNESELKELFSLSAEISITMQALPCPVISLVNGAAIGAGCQLALSADFVVASEEAYFQTAGGANGWFCFTPMVALSRCLVPRRALEMLLAGEKLKADAALELGVVNRLAKPKRLQREGISLLMKVTKGNPEMIARGKRAFYEQLLLPAREAYEKAAEQMAETACMPSAQERIRSFLGKNNT